MTVITFAFIVCLHLARSNSEEVNKGEVVQLGKKQDAAAGPTSVDSRFFDLGGIINELFPGLNQGNQGGPERNPAGMNFPDNSQFYPAVAIQGPPVSTGQGSVWPIIDDAKLYPNQGQPNTQAPYSIQGNFGGLPQSQYPNQGNFGGAPQIQNTQYPNQGHFGGLALDFGGQPNFNGPYPFGRPPLQNKPFPNQGNFGNTRFPNQGNWQGLQTNFRPQNPNQGNMLGSRPSLNSQYPNQGGLQPFPQFPNQVNNGYPNQGPNQDVFASQNQNNFGRPSGSDGTLDSLVPPDEFPFDPSNPDSPDFQTPDPIDQPMDPEERPAILGSPVIVPVTTEETGIINYPTSTESPAKKQCVQDCQTTSEYNPVCGSDNVTYINPGKFVCARNCGINVFVTRRGRCVNDTPSPPNSLCSNSVQRKMCL